MSWFWFASTTLTSTSTKEMLYMQVMANVMLFRDDSGAYFTDIRLMKSSLSFTATCFYPRGSL